METLNEQQLDQLLDREITLTKKLQGILELEKKALADRQPELLQKLAADKLQLLDEIETNHQDNVKISSEKNIKDFRWEKLIHGFENSNFSLLKKCDDYKQLLVDVEHLNTVNAKTASRMQNSISELIKIIRGNGPSQKLYTPKGSASVSNTYSSIAKA